MRQQSGGPTDRETARRVLARARVFAVVGASDRPGRPSHGVMQALLAHGYVVVPITPRSDQVLGLPAYPDLAAVPPEITIDVVDLFRRSAHVGPHVDEAIARGAWAVWFQFGVRDDAAVGRARQAGLEVVQERCPAIELGPARRR